MLPPTLAARPDLSSGCSNFLGCLPPRASLMHGVLNSMLQFCFYCSLSEEPIKSLNLFGSFHFAARAILQNDRTSIHIQWLSAAGSWPGQANQVHKYIQIITNMTKDFKHIQVIFQQLPAYFPPSQPFQQSHPTFWQFPQHIDGCPTSSTTWETEPIASSKALPSKPQALLLSSTRAYPTCDGWTLDCSWSDWSESAAHLLGSSMTSNLEQSSGAHWCLPFRCPLTLVHGDVTYGSRLKNHDGPRSKMSI